MNDQRWRESVLARYAELMNWNGPHSEAVSRFEQRHRDDTELVSLMETAKMLKIALTSTAR